MPSERPSRIYLDHAATTPLCPEARDAMLPWLTDGFGNPSSLHAEGRRAKDAIDSARETLSNALECLFAEVLFTSGGTEAANLAILGAALNNIGSRRNRVLIGASEHHCVLNTAGTLRSLGFRPELIQVDREARLDLNALGDALGDDVLLVSCMHANNEFGSINPIRQIADLAHRYGALLHTDAVQTFQALGMRWTVSDLDADLVTVSAHKLYGPKGAGAIYNRAGIKLKPLVTGGGQEREMRGGTENTAAIAGFGAAAARTPAASDVRKLRDSFVERLTAVGAVPSVNSWDNVLPTHAHVRFPEIDAETMLIVLDRLGVSASSGAACSSGSIEPSHVLLAAGYSEIEAKEGLRFSLGRSTTFADIEDATNRVTEAVNQIRGVSRTLRGRVLGVS